MAADTVTTRRMRAMSCSATMTLAVGDHTDANRVLDRAVARLGQLERRWSRFVDDSEITGLNQANGQPRRCSSDTVALVSAMVAGWTLTDGRFDPSLLGPLVELGYDTSRTDGSTAPRLLIGSGFGRRVDLITIDPDAGVVQLPAGVTLDPGGVGKGLAADIVAAELVDALGGRAVAGAAVEIGGDIRVLGRGPDDGAWSIAIAHPDEGATEFVRLCDGGIATSSTRLRTWSRGRVRHHHLIDPRSRRPTTSGVAGCTVIAGSAALAETFTKVAFVDGAALALDRFAAHGLAARVIGDDALVDRTTSWEAFAA